MQQDLAGFLASLTAVLRSSSQLQEEKQSKGDASGVGLRRYQFYFSRYENHMKSIKFAERMIADTGARDASLCAASRAWLRALPCACLCLA